MNKIIYLSLAFLFVSGCVDTSALQHNNEQNNFKCDINEPAAPQPIFDKESFAKLLTSQAAISSLNDFTKKTKLDTLQITGWNQNTALSIYECYRQKRESQITMVNSEFKKMKELTKGSDERIALVNAYSSWEAYMKNPGAESENDFQQKVAFYKNM